MDATRTDLSVLRRELAGLEGGAAPSASGLFSFGWPDIDGGLGGGLARGAMHEVFAAEVSDAVAATGFGCALGMRAAKERTIVWARQDFIDAEMGGPHGPGLAEFGLDPERLILVRARDGPGALRAGAEAARCCGLGAVIVEVWGAPKALDLTATRRLAIAVGKSGVPLIMIRMNAEPSPSAAVTRWAVSAATSVPLAANAPGHPAFAITLLRHRAGVPGRTWYVEWDRDRRSFTDASPLSRDVVSVPASQPAAADGNGPELRRIGLRRTG